MKCEKCGGELHQHRLLKAFLHCSSCKTTIKINSETGESRKVSYDKEPIATQPKEDAIAKPKKPEFKILQDYDDDGWRLIQYPNGEQWWEHKNPTIEPEENIEILSGYDEFGWRRTRSRITGEVSQQHRDYELPIRPYTLEQAIAFWQKVETHEDVELLKYLCDPFGRGLLVYKKSYAALSKEEKGRLHDIAERKTNPQPIVPRPTPNLSEGFNFPYVCGEINRRLRDLGLDRSSDRVIEYAKANGLAVDRGKLSLTQATDRQLLDLLEVVKAWEKEVATA